MRSLIYEKSSIHAHCRQKRGVLITLQRRRILQINQLLPRAVCHQIGVQQNHLNTLMLIRATVIKVVAAVGYLSYYAREDFNRSVRFNMCQL